MLQVKYRLFPMNHQFLFSFGRLNYRDISTTPTSGYQDTNFRHYDAQLTSFGNRPVIIGGYHNNKMEQFDNDKWIDVNQPFPTYTA